MGRGPNLTDEQIERIKQLFAENGNISATARAMSMSASAVKRHCKRTDEYADLRHEKRITLIGTIADELAEVRQLYLNHLKEPAVIAAASAKDSAVIVGIATDKHQLVTGEATERSEHVDVLDARNRLVARIDEIASRRAARGDHGDERGAG